MPTSIEVREWIAFVLAILVCTAVPTLALFWIPTPGLETVDIVLTACLGFVCTLQIIEAISSLFYKEDTYFEVHPNGRQTVTIIISAYLPNEQGIIMTTLSYYENLVYNDTSGNRLWNVVLGYNTPVDLPVEEQLREYENKHDWFQAVRVPDSRSKATNINYVLDTVESLGEIIGLFDADHYPYFENIERACFWITNRGYDYVQGRCVIRSDTYTLLETWVVFNYELMYTLQHKSRHVLWGYALFGGTNGYFKKEVIKDLKFREDMLTEDIDCACRAITKGYRGIYDRMLISSEEAPPTVSALYRQRRRWCFGYFQVTLFRTFGLIFNRKTSFRQKIGLLLLLPMRELWNYVQIMAIPCTIILALRTRTFNSIYLVIVFTIYDFMLYPIQALAMYVRSKELWHRIGFYKMFAIAISNIAYVWAETFMAIYGHISITLRVNKWVVTKRRVTV